MFYSLPALLPLVPPEQFVVRLNAGATSGPVRACAREYADKGRLLLDRRPKAERDQMQADLEQFNAKLIYTQFMGKDRAGIPLETRSPSLLPAFDWFALLGLWERGIRLGLCPDPKCGRFFLDPKHRGKSACSRECASRIRARAYREKLKKSPRKLNRYRKRQRELMRQRRAAGLA